MRTSYLVSIFAALAIAASASEDYQSSTPECLKTCDLNSVSENQDPSKTCDLAKDLINTGCMSSCPTSDLAQIGSMFVASQCGSESDFESLVNKAGAAPEPSVDYHSSTPECLVTCDLTAISENQDPSKMCGLAEDLINTGCMNTCPTSDLEHFGSMFVASKCGSESEFESLVKKAGAGVETTTVIESALTMSGYTTASFDDAAQAQFVTGVADVLGVDAANVKITEVIAARRRLLSGITVKFTVTVSGPASTVLATTSSITAALDSSQSSSLTTSLQNAGLTNVSVTGVSAPTKTTTTSASCIYSSMFSIVVSSLLVLFMSI